MKIIFLSKFLKKVNKFFLYYIVPEKLFIKYQFKRKFGFKPNLIQPKTFNEKIQWLKLYDRRPIHTTCADKYSVRDYVKMKIGEQYLIPLVFSTIDVLNISSDKLPDYPVIIKPNHDSGSYYIIKSKNNVDFDYVRKLCKKWLKRNYYYFGKEWQYKHINRKIIIEKLLLTKEGRIPNDYKFHCINGKVFFIQVDLDRQQNHTRNLYDRNWNKLDIKWVYDNGYESNQPECLKEMISLSEKLATEFDYVRIDLYEVDNKIYFGEITFHPEAGFGYFEPFEWDLILGEKLNITT